MFTFTLGTGEVINTELVEVKETKATIVCKLSCFPKDIRCVPLFVAIWKENNFTNLTDPSFHISNITGDPHSYSYPSQSVTVTNLTIGNTYILCVRAYNLTTTELLGDKMCHTFMIPYHQTFATTPHYHNEGIIVYKCFVVHVYLICC